MKYISGANPEIILGKRKTVKTLESYEQKTPHRDQSKLFAEALAGH